ncbi:MAG: hypothetical protein J6V59_02680 [Alistipes sp.]|nr:hypothetical protein [Alistipes sp.]
MKRVLLFMAAVMLFNVSVRAQEVVNEGVDAVVEAAAVEADVAPQSSRFLPTSRRVDRNVDNVKFVFKGEVMLGLTASYGTLDVSDSDLMLLFDDINLNVRRTAVMPFVAYSYRDNRAVGLRFGYEFLQGDLGNIALDLGSGAELSFGLSDINLRNESYSWSAFHRNYIGLDRRGIIGAILETELLVKTGTTTFSMGSGESRDYSVSKNFAAKLNINPGVAVYVFPQVCVTVTVGIGGLTYNQIRQQDLYGVETGRRDHSALKFKLNIADIQIGVVAHLWNKKK